jgi:hypothetical protein
MDRIIYYQNAGLKTKKIFRFVLSVSLVTCSALACADTPQTKAAWYRYYDKNGVANISTSVTPAHIKNGYEALDRNMQVIKRNHAYNVEKDLQQSTLRASEVRKLEQDARLKRAYGNSSVATNKRNELLNNLKQQINLQNQNLKQLQSDRIILKRQEMEYYRKGNTVPSTLKDRIKYNAENIDKTKGYMEGLQNNYRQTQNQYDDIINRLKKLE